MSRPRLITLLLALVTLAVYLPVARHDFLTYDDDAYITENPIVQEGLTLAGLKWAFTTGHASNWHPLTWLSHMTDCTLFGLNAGAHHFVSVIFHAANASLLFILLLRLTGKIWPSAFVAALFAWHPLHVESVAWAAERKDVLSVLFALLALLSYAKYAQLNRWRSYWFALFFFALGLLSKPMLVTLPFIMLLLDFWPLQRFSTSTFRFSLLVEKIPFFLLTGVSCLVTFLVQQHGHAVATLDQIPPGLRLQNAAVALVCYVQKIFWPSPLAVIYPLAPISAGAFARAAAVMSVLCVAVLRASKHNRCWLVGWFWFVGALVPVIGIVQVGDAAMADRYSYLPSIGIFIAVVFGLSGLAEKSSWLKKILSLGMALVLASAIGWTEWQLHFWRDTETLFRHTLAVTTDNDKAHLNLGITLDQQGRLPEALAEYEETLRLAPGRYQIHFNLGCILGKLGRHAEALAEIRQAIRADPEIALWHCTAGVELATLGQSGEALKEFAEAGRLKPDYAEPHIESAKIYFQLGRDHEAVAELHAALQAEPDHFQILATVARYLAANENPEARDGSLALKLATTADELSGHVQPMVLDTLGMAYAETGDFSSAQACARNALEFAEALKLKDIEAIRQRIEFYQNRQPWRESFRATNAPGKN